MGHRNFNQVQLNYLAARAALDIANSDYAARMKPWDYLLDTEGEAADAAGTRYETLSDEASEACGLYDAQLAMESAEQAMVEWAKNFVKTNKATAKRYKQEALFLEPMWTTYRRTLDGRRRMVNMILSLEA